jgi:hypothetical protein
MKRLEDFASSDMLNAIVHISECLSVLEFDLNLYIKRLEDFASSDMLNVIVHI